MPIIQVRASQSDQYLTIPSPQINPEQILTEWFKSAWQSEMFVYPPDYMGDVTPARWDMHSFILQVDGSGEQAQLMAVSKQQTDQEATEVLERLRTANPEQIKSIGNFATVSESNRSSIMTVSIGRTALAVGGVVMHVRRSRLHSLENMFSTTFIDT